MKAQFKYAFMTGIHIRGIIFAVIFAMMAIFITLGSLGRLPVPAHITAVSLGGVAIAVMFAANIICDVSVIRRMFAAPEAYLYLLTPVPRRKILLASVITMLAMDFITMAVAITGEVWLSFNFTGLEWNMIFSALKQNSSDLLFVIWGIPLLIAGYLLIMMIILFAVTAKRSIFFKMPASGLLAFLLACACFYAVSLLQLILIPFSSVQRYGLLIIVNVNNSAALPVLVLLTLLEAAGLFFVTSKLMERRINI
jgi:hypothetical protein